MTVGSAVFVDSNVLIYAAIFSPLKLSRTELIRTAIREKMAQLRAQLKKINPS